KLVIEQERLDEIRTVRVFRKIAVEVDVSPLDFRFQFPRCWIVRIVDFQVWISLGVSVNDVVDKVLIRWKAPGGAGAQTHPSVFAARNVLSCTAAIAYPMKLAADVDETLNLEVRAVENRSNERVVVIEFRIRGDHNSGLRVRVF